LYTLIGGQRAEKFENYWTKARAERANKLETKMNKEKHKLR